ncbi:hypothetical protein [Clostridium kluyveri]|nr:hypothetical protein [Clostridium kluyveri]BAH07359.1 hypothetical protein CKR_2308 [Clostridium kluyveri NBRC 12016]
MVLRKDNWICREELISGGRLYISMYERIEANRLKGLFKGGLVSHEEIAHANDTVLNEHRPVCIYKDGVFLLDDVGGLSGFANFLGTVYESEDKVESNELRAWAKRLG